MFPARLLLFSALAVRIVSAESSGIADEVLPLSTRDDLAGPRDVLVAQAIKELKKPVITRPTTLGELLEKYRWSMKYTEKPAHQAKLTDAEWERFALSLSDANLNGNIGERLPRFAAAYVFSKDERLAGFVRAQLSELATWKPLERPGTVSTRQNFEYAPWLGTGWGIRGITETLEIMPDESVPAELRSRLTANLEAEMGGIRASWKARKLWYTREDSAYSNQWVLPNVGLVLASIHTGLDKHRDDFQFGVDNLVKSLDAQGASGEFAEGVSYAGLTMNALLSAAEAAAHNGDRRLLDHPYLRKFPIWYVHHLQPGGKIINAFDSKVEDLDPTLLARFVSAVKSPEALWAIRRGAEPDFGDKLPGLIGRASADFEPKEPPLFGKYDFAARVNWRDSWNDETAAGFWMRGGHSSDAHDHEDRGHISFSIGNREILLEAGIASYGIPEHPTHYRSVAGHNVLQIGKADPSELTAAVLKTAGQLRYPKNRSAPITVEKLDATGGSVSVDASACYALAEKWIRQATWDRQGVAVRDEVVLKSPDFVTFRWHLGTAPDATKSITDGKISIGGIEVAYDADSPVIVTIKPMPEFDPSAKKALDHACVVIRSKEPVKSLVLKSTIRPE